MIEMNAQNGGQQTKRKATVTVYELKLFEKKVRLGKG